MVRTCARSWRRRGDADASTTLCRRSVFKHGMLSGGGGPRGGRGAPGVPEGDLLCALGAGAIGLSVYGGGGSDGRRFFDMVARVDVTLRGIAGGYSLHNDAIIHSGVGKFTPAIESRGRKRQVNAVRGFRESMEGVVLAPTPLTPAAILWRCLASCHYS